MLKSGRFIRYEREGNFLYAVVELRNGDRKRITVIGAKGVTF